MLRELLVCGIPPPHMLPSAQGEHMPHQLVTASLCCALTTTQFLVFPIYMYFLHGAPDVPWGVQLAAPAFTLPQGEASCCQGVGYDLGRAVGAVPPAKPCAVPHSLQPRLGREAKKPGNAGKS